VLHVCQVFFKFCSLVNDFYRAMHYSAKRGLAIACRLSVCLSICPSVTLVDHDHIGGKSWKLIAPTISATFSLFVAKRSSLLPGEHGEILGRLEWGGKKVACWSTKAAISLKRIKIEEKLLWRACRKSSTLFRFFWGRRHISTSGFASTATETDECICHRRERR